MCHPNEKEHHEKEIPVLSPINDRLDDEVLFFEEADVGCEDEKFHYTAFDGGSCGYPGKFVW